MKKDCISQILTGDLIGSTAEGFYKMKLILKILLVLSLASTGLSADATIIMLDYVRCDGGDIHLGQIADIFGIDKLLVAKLNSIYLYEAPAPGETVKINRFNIKMRIKAVGVDQAKVQIRGSLDTVISNSDKTASGNPLADAAADFIESHYASQSETCDIKFRHLPELDDSHSTGAVLKVITSPAQRYRGNVVVVVGAFVDGRVVKKYPLSLTVRTYCRVLVARKNLNKSQALLPGDFTMEKRETTRLRQSPITSLNNLAGQRASRFIWRGSVLTYNQMEPIPAVHRGDVVTITLQRENFLITAQGRARKSGGIGEMIPVINLSSHKEISVRIVDSETVVVVY